MSIRPITIEFIGPPKSGKTTLMNGLADGKTFSKYSVKVIQDSAESVPKEFSEKNWERNVWITLEKIQSLLKIPYMDTDVIFIDRGYYDCLFWARFLLSYGICSQEQSDSLYTTIKRVNLNMNIVPDYLFIVDVSVEEAVRRCSYSNIFSFNTTEFINSYKKEFETFLQTIPSDRKFGINTSNSDISNSLNWAYTCLDYKLSKII